jgi:hypothetical protein
MFRSVACSIRPASYEIATYYFSNLINYPRRLFCLTLVYLSLSLDLKTIFFYEPRSTICKTLCTFYKPNILLNFMEQLRSCYPVTFNCSFAY